MARKKVKKSARGKKTGKLCVGFIGCGGNMRGRHLDECKRNRKVALVAVSDPNPAAAELLFDKLGKKLPLYKNYKKMIDTENLDAIVISTPHSQHFTQIKYAMERGVDVLVEKPLTIKSSHTKTLFALAKRKKRVLHVAYQRHHYAEYMYAKHLIESGEIGKIQASIGYVTQGWINAGGWRKDPKLAGGGMFMDTGSHLVASTLFLTGQRIHEVTALMDNCGEPVDINAVVSIRYQSGAVGTINTIGSCKRHDERLAIHGDKGCLVMELHQWGIKSMKLNGEDLTVPKKFGKAVNADKAFYDWVLGAPGYTIPAYALEVAYVSEAAYRSAKARKVVRVSRK